MSAEVLGPSEFVAGEVKIISDIPLRDLYTDPLENKVQLPHQDAIVDIVSIQKPDRTQYGLLWKGPESVLTRRGLFDLLTGICKVPPERERIRGILDDWVIYGTGVPLDRAHAKAFGEKWDEFGYNLNLLTELLTKPDDKRLLESFKEFREGITSPQVVANRLNDGDLKMRADQVRSLPRDVASGMGQFFKKHPEYLMNPRQRRQLSRSSNASAYLQFRDELSYADQEELAQAFLRNSFSTASVEERDRLVRVFGKNGMRLREIHALDGSFAYAPNLSGSGKISHFADGTIKTTLFDNYLDGLGEVHARVLSTPNGIQLAGIRPSDDQLEHYVVPFAQWETTQDGRREPIVRITEDKMLPKSVISHLDQYADQAGVKIDLHRFNPLVGFWTMCYQNPSLRESWGRKRDFAGREDRPTQEINRAQVGLYSLLDHARKPMMTSPLFSQAEAAIR